MRTHAARAVMLAAALLLVAAPAGRTQQTPPVDSVADLAKRIEALEKKLAALDHANDQLMKKIDDVLWFERVGDVAHVDKVYYASVPNPKGEETYGIANERHPFRVWAYVFVPNKLDRGKKAPLLLLPHGGVHADFDTYYTHIVRELMEEGHVVEKVERVSAEEQERLRRQFRTP